MPPDAAGSWLDWCDDFLIAGNSGDDKERHGVLSLTFRNVRIFKLAPVQVESGGESVQRIKAELYCEEIRFSYGPPGLRR